MLEPLIVTAAVACLVAGPLAWRLWRDRMDAQALALHAEILQDVRRILGGDSLLGIEVRAALPWRRGRVILSVPGGWEWLVESVVRPVLARTPGDYDLVVHATASPRPAGVPLEPIAA